MFDASLEIAKCDARRTRATLDQFRTIRAVEVHSYGRAAHRSLNRFRFASGTNAL
jgi:hypothetical protein